MDRLQDNTAYEFSDEFRHLFYRRTIICLWLGIVFFSLFSLLDFVCCRELFVLFLGYRLVVIASLFTSFGILRIKAARHLAPFLMFIVLMVGTFSISLMTLELGGFTSGYYVGILLIVVGAFSVLPLHASQAITTGLLMYLVYVVTILFGTGLQALQHIEYGLTNSFFFLSLIGGTAVQCMDDMQVRQNSLHLKNIIHDLQSNLIDYTDNLEHLIEKRMAEQAETALKFRDLYDNLLDLAVLIDRKGTIQTVNQHSLTVLGKPPEELAGRNILEFIRSQDEDNNLLEEIISAIYRDNDLQGMQLQIHKSDGADRDVELGGSRVVMEDNTIYFQLILRDISITKQMERQILESEQLIDTSRQAAIFGLAKLAECRDDETGAHLERIRLYTKILTNELKNQPDMHRIITKTFIEDIYRSSILHDIGKVGIPDSILLKPGKLTQSEYSIMKNHCIFGSTTLEEAETGPESISFLQMAKDIAHYHHERWDGSGYPEGLTGDSIPLSARIVALADVYDALTTARVYKPALDHEKTKQIILQQCGSQFDPFIVDAFLKKEEEFKKNSGKILIQ